MFFKYKAFSSVLALCIAASSAGAATLFSDNFDADTQALGSTNGTAPLNNWDVTAGSVDVIGAGGPYDFYPGNGNYLDMNGSTGTAGTIQTKSMYGSAGSQKYTLSFSWGVNTFGGLPKTLSFSFGTFSDSIVIASDPGSLQPASYTFTTTGPSFLSFSGAPDSNGGPVLDNVILAAVPIPAAGLMLLGAIGGLGALRRRNREALKAA